MAMSPVSAFGANKFHFVLFNNPGTISQCLVVKVRLVVWKPGNAAVTGATGGLFTLRRRSGLTTNPSGTGGLAIVAMDSSMPIPTAIGAWSPPQVAPAGGTVAIINEIPVQPDESKVSTLDAPTMAEIRGEFGGQSFYRHLSCCKPLTIRSGETLEIQQSSTAGTGNGRALVLFTVG